MVLSPTIKRPKPLRLLPSPLSLSLREREDARLADSLGPNPALNSPQMFQKVLIANRGEIACRILRTAKALGVRTAAVYAADDAGALFTRLADEAHPLHGAGYLDGPQIVALARAIGADCLHPGYGFLSENPEFAEQCAAAKIAFIGPNPEAMRALGLKHQAKALAHAVGAPVLPGYAGDNQNPKFLKEKAYEIGYPVLIKAVAGGGGRGMRVVSAHAAFEEALEAAQREAVGAFGDSRVLIEKFVVSARHVEVQIFGDWHGHVVHLYERDCSAQRRHQKLIEESPAPNLRPATRLGMTAAAVALARAAGYTNAGTVEFLVDPATEAFYFLELNARLQVEHPVTEAVTGLDLVAWQFKVAAGEGLPLRQDQIRLHGHAVEVRLCAEDPENGFLPAPGRLAALHWPALGPRIESGVEAGNSIAPRYDSMIAKLIAHGETRAEAIGALQNGLSDTLIAGPKTNIAFLRALLGSPTFQVGEMTTHFIDDHLAELGATPRGLDVAATLAGVTALRERGGKGWADSRDPWDVADAFEIMGPRRVSFDFLVEGVQERFVESAGRIAFADGRTTTSSGSLNVIADGDAVFVLNEGRQTRVVPLTYSDALEAKSATASAEIRAPMPGRVVALDVAEGDEVQQGQRLGALEAMKMEHALTAPWAGRVAKLSVAVGDVVEQGATLMQVEAN